MLERTQVVGVDRPKRQFRESRTPWARWRLDVRHRRFQMKSQAKNAAARRWRLETECLIRVLSGRVLVRRLPGANRGV